ncbi:reverse transcriptase [Rhodocyclus tenuis]|uniref:RNA-directed DNA polymerase n=1 Tax=Rhodocyclus gracilis TaxID=2929842 RepID=UPI001298D13E|nr:RNA-directed DNA polymerase [Rhodocyclus gracilis]MRD72735.1 reverse transcriptase [Rhodocyclus gracilis]
MLKPSLNHFERAACEIAAHGDNDTLPFDLDVRFCGDKAIALAAIAFGFYQELRDGPVKLNHKRIAAMHVYSERLIAPSGPTGFRVVTKMHPFWNIYLNGLAIAIIEALEPQREPHAHSYRYLPDGGNQLFNPNRSWRAFKEFTVELADAAGQDAVVVQTDISSFYEHVSHHYIENFINDLGGDCKQVSKQINALLGKLSAGRSFGLPVGGQGARVLAELFLNQVDLALTAAGVKWSRYVDDYVLIAENTADAYHALGALGQGLMDYGLSLNKSKTVFLSSKHYRDYVKSQLGSGDDEATLLRTIDLKFDPYSDTPDEDYELLKETVETLEVRRLLNRELEKALPDTFLVTQIGRTMRLHEPYIALEIASTLLNSTNLHAFRSSFSTIMRGIANLRADERFECIHERLDLLLDAVPSDSAHLLTVDTSLLHYMRCLRFRSTPKRAMYVRNLYDTTQLDAVRRVCIDCWRNWGDRRGFNLLRNRWHLMTAECQRLFWLATYKFGDEGDAVRRQFCHATPQAWALGVEVPLNEESDKEKLKKHPRGMEPRFAAVYETWAEEAENAD